jgi:hypothetical protein
MQSRAASRTRRTMNKALSTAQTVHLLLILLMVAIVVPLTFHMANGSSTSGTDDTMALHSPLIGGFSAVDSGSNADGMQDSVQNAAKFAVDTLLGLGSSGAGSPKPPVYSFMKDDSWQKQPWSAEVVQAWSQVVAGMNYRMIVKISSARCIGVMAVTVYDHFGTQSVTYWGPRDISCAEIELLQQDVELNKKQQEISKLYTEYFEA